MPNHSTLISRTLIVLGLTAGAVAAAPGLGSADTLGQITVFDHTGSQTSSQYFDPVLNQPNDYTKPADYANGRVFVKLDVLSKPSDRAIIPQLCFWRHTETTKFKYETCANTKKFAFTTTGTVWIDAGTPENWYKKNGVWDWSQRASLGRIMLKDLATGKLLLTSRCGAACYRGDDIADHVPVRMTAETIFVAKGSVLSPPNDWVQGCPSTWSSKCQSSGSAAPIITTPPPTTTTTTPPITTTPPSTTTTTTPITTTPPSTAPATTAPPTTAPPTTAPATTAPATTAPATTAPPTTAPVPPELVVTQPEISVVASGGGLDVSWTQVPGSHLSQFRHREGWKRWQWNQPGEQLAHRIDGVNSSTRYQIEVRSLLGGVWHDWASVTVEPGSVPLASTTQSTGDTSSILGSPTQPALHVTTYSTGFEASWEPMAGVNLYQFRYQVDNGKWQWDQPADQLERTVTGLPSATNHVVEVRALINGTWHDWTSLPVTTR